MTASFLPTLRTIQSLKPGMEMPKLRPMQKALIRFILMAEMVRLPFL
jgi:hypothetical protein